MITAIKLLKYPILQTDRKSPIFLRTSQKVSKPPKRFFRRASP